MTMTKSCKCDHCKQELITHSGYPANYSLQLSAIDTNVHSGGVVFDVYVVPPIDSDKHFCGFVCLQQWLLDNKRTTGAWQPIATAPVGTNIDVWAVLIDNPSEGFRFTDVSRVNNFWYGLDLSRYTPKYWMSIPKQP